jgi:hypothetical protein
MMTRFAWAVGLVGLLAPSAAADPDLTKLDRAIKREPVYQTKAPRYCLLVFGPEARTRVWLVLDGDVLYVDRNGNGDLTEPDERFTARSTPGDAGPTYPFAEIREYPVIDQIPTDGGRKYTRFHVTHTTIKKDFTPVGRDNQALKGRFDKDPALTRAGVTLYLDDKVRVQAVSEWTDRPGTAPVCHIGGPLTMAPLQRQELLRGNEATELQFCLGFHGLGRWAEEAFAILDYNEVPKEFEPVAEFTFDHRDAGQPPLPVKVKLTRC